MTKVFFENLTEAKIDETIIKKIETSVKTAVEREYPRHMLEVSITFCNNDYIREINRQYREKDSITDVLSFPMLDFEEPDNETLLGDIIISLEKAGEQAVEYGHSMCRELCFLAVHSALHLLGYDHEGGDSERIEMEKLQEDILNSLDIRR